MSLRSFMEDPTIPDSVKQQVWSSAPQGRKNEYYYERGVRDPLRGLISKGISNIIPFSESGQDFVKGGKPAGPIGRAAASWTVPEDLAALGSMAGQIGGPLGVEIGGTAGGVLQGRPVGQAAIAAAPAAIMSKIAPWATKTAFNSRIAKGISDKASSKIGDAAGGLFKRYTTKGLEKTPSGLADFFGRGQAGPALQETGKALNDFRRILTTQPAFGRVMVKVPVRVPVPGSPMSQIGYQDMTLGEAMEYQQSLYGRGFNPQGALRGGIQSGPDRGLATQVRRNILVSLGRIPNIGPRVAQQYADLSHDYGVASTLNEVFTPQTVDPSGMLNHEQIYKNLADPKRLNHLNNLVGPEKTQQFLSDVAPGRERIGSPESQARFHLPHIGIHLPLGGPKAPAEFMPGWVQSVQPIAGGFTAQGVEKASGGGQ